MLANSLCTIYHRSGNFHVKNNSRKKFRGSFNPQKFFNVDGYNMNENQVSLAVTLWLSRVVVDRTFTSGGLDVCTQAYLLIIAV